MFSDIVYEGDIWAQNGLFDICYLILYTSMYSLKYYPLADRILLAKSVV